MANPLARLMGGNQLQLTPSPERSRLVQLLQQQSAQPQQSFSTIGSLNIASKPILAALLARQERQGRQNVAGTQQSLARAMQIANDPNATPGDKAAATNIVQTESSRLPADNPIGMFAAEQMMTPPESEPIQTEAFFATVTDSDLAQQLGIDSNKQIRVFQQEQPDGTVVMFADTDQGRMQIRSDQISTASQSVVSEDKSAPQGYRWEVGENGEQTGNLEPVPGGPADVEAAANAAREASMSVGEQSLFESREIIFNEDGSPNRAAILAFNANVPFTEGRRARTAWLEAAEARIRAESGAAVPDTEIDRMWERLAPRNGDSDPQIIMKYTLFEQWFAEANQLVSPTGKTASEIVGDLHNRLTEAYREAGLNNEAELADLDKMIDENAEALGL